MKEKSSNNIEKYTYEIPENAVIGPLNIEDIKENLTDSSVNLYIAENTFESGKLYDLATYLDKIKNPNNIKYQYHFYDREDTENISSEVSLTLKENFEIDTDISKYISTKIEELTNLMASVGQYPKPFVSFRIVNKGYLGVAESASVSREWHIDSAKYTLTATMFGSNTEWTPNYNVKREYFTGENKIMDPKDSELEAVTDPALVLSYNETSSAILKGELRVNEAPSSLEFFEELGIKDYVPYNENLGLVHRGPNLENDDMRLVLTISTF